jgi:Ca2+-transporting ATPase
MNPAYRFLKDPANYDEVEKDSVFLGFSCIQDPIRPEAPEALRIAK